MASPETHFKIHHRIITVHPKPVHLICKKRDIAEYVITAGDPARIEQLLKLLKKPRLVNTNRGFITYTGYYDGKKVTLCTHGVGGPSSAIVFEELAMLGAKVIVRLGTTGAMIKGLNIGDFVVPTAAAYNEGSLKMYVPESSLPPVADVELTSKIIKACREEGVEPVVGLVFSSDAFYAEDPMFVSKWTRLGVISVEMECATLFTLGLLRKFKAASLLVVADSLVDPSQAVMVSAQKLRPQVLKAGKIILTVLSQG